MTAEDTADAVSLAEDATSVVEDDSHEEVPYNKKLNFAIQTASDVISTAYRVTGAVHAVDAVSLISGWFCPDGESIEYGNKDYPIPGEWHDSDGKGQRTSKAHYIPSGPYRSAD